MAMTAITIMIAAIRRSGIFRLRRLWHYKTAGVLCLLEYQIIRGDGWGLTTLTCVPAPGMYLGRIS